MIVYGPRGNGKTALLRYLQQETSQKAKSSLNVMWAKPFDLQDQNVFANYIIGDEQSFWAKFKRFKLTASYENYGLSAETEKHKPTANLMNLLRAKCQKNPLILIVDEAHTITPEAGQLMLNISQDLRSEGNPFLLVLAGTPNLESALRKANASFWDRSAIFPLGRLNPEEARQAIMVPLEKEGISFNPGTGEQIVERTYGYPYFTQVWGKCLVDMLNQTGERTISMRTVNEVEADVTLMCKTMYRARRNEIEDKKLLAVAERVADAFKLSGEPYLDKSILDEAIERGMSDEKHITAESALEKAEQLFHLGYVWQVTQPDGQPGYEPGIPSLMSHIDDLAMARKRKEASKVETADAPQVDNRAKRRRKEKSKGRSIDFDM